MKSLNKIDFTPEQQHALCEAIATSTDGLGHIVKVLQSSDKTFPSLRTIYNRLREDENFSEIYAKAKSDQSDILVAEMLEIADAPLDEDSNAGVQRARLRVETRKWIASKLKPKLYGDKSDRAAIAIQINTNEQQFDFSKYANNIDLNNS